MNLPITGSQSLRFCGLVFVLFFVVLVVCFCCVWFVVEDDGFLDYVQVLHQFSFVALNQQTASRVNLEINAFTMP